MSDLKTKIEELLGRKIDLQESNYYELFGLLPFEADRQKIESALNKTILRLRKSKETADKKAWESVVPVVQKAKAILLDAERKGAYDLELRSQRNLLSQVTSAKGGQSDVGFPSADPCEAFDMAAYVQGIGPGFESENSIDERLNELKRELNLASLWDSVSPSAAVKGASQQEGIPQSIANQITPPLDSSVTSILKTPSARMKSTRQRGKRSKLSSTQLLTATLVLGSLLFVLFGATYYGLNLLWKGQSSVAQTNPIRKEPSSTNGPKPKNRTTTTFDVESTKFDIGSSPFEMPGLQEPNAMAPNPTMTPSTEATPTPGTPSSPMLTTPTPTTPTPTTPTPTTPTPATPMLSESMVPATGKTMSTEGAMGPMTDEEREKLKRSLKSARKAIDDWDFARFESEITLALPLAREAPYRDQIARLDQLGQLKKIFFEAVKGGVAKLSAGETFKVMNTLVAFVEGNDEFIIVKMGGESAKHPLKNLPMGIGLGLADLSLDSDAGTDMGARAVYCLLLPKQSTVSEREGKKFLEKGIQTGKIRPDLWNVFEDKYE